MQALALRLPPLLRLRSGRAGSQLLNHSNGSGKYIEGILELSTLPSTPTAALPQWKQEVNRRIAEHKNRRGLSVVDDAAADSNNSANSRAAAAAARVAARYAKAPSYSEMQAAEARTAVRATEAAARAAIEAHAAAQAVLDHIETEGEQSLHTSVAEPAAEWQSWQHPTEHVDPHSLEIRWEPDLPVRPAHPEIWQAVADWEPHLDTQYDSESLPIYEAVDGAQPIPANLIQFPREIVAPRRMRPRTEASPDDTQSQQLSIFEVDPASVSTEPMAATTAPAAEPKWIGSSWQQIELDEQPQPLPDYYAIPAEDAPKLYQAPFGRRMMATLVDTALILALVCGIAFLAASKLDQLPGKHTSEFCAIIAIFGIAALYEWFFLTFAKVTPGMRYAQLSLCTFDEEMPTREQIKGRMKAMLISVLPMGLGMLWSIFDEDQMSWHDRLSKTYLRLS